MIFDDTQSNINFWGIYPLISFVNHQIGDRTPLDDGDGWGLSKKKSWFLFLTYQTLIPCSFLVQGSHGNLVFKNRENRRYLGFCMILVDTQLNINFLKANPLISFVKHQIGDRTPPRWWGWMGDGQKKSWFLFFTYLTLIPYNFSMCGSHGNVVFKNRPNPPKMTDYRAYVYICISASDGNSTVPRRRQLSIINYNNLDSN